MSKNVEAPLLLTALAVMTGNGYIEAAWTWIYNTTHGGNPNTSKEPAFVPPSATNPDPAVNHARLRTQ